MPLLVSADRFLGSLLGQAVGDALGAPYEGVPADYIYYVHGPIHELLARPSNQVLRYTDDTQMLIGVAETLIARGKIDPDFLMRQFADNYEPDRGYGQGARRILECARQQGNWRELAQSVFPGGSFGNGAAMRVAPIGLVYAHDLTAVAEQARASALPTHQHPLGIEGAQILALAVALAAQGPPLDRVAFYRRLRQDCHCEEFQWQLRAAQKLRRGDSFGFLGNSLPAHQSVVTAIACFATNSNSYEDAISTAITFGDDTDTLAAMAGALAGAHLGSAAIPTRWIERLERGPRGVDYLRELARRLHGCHAELVAAAELA